VLIDPAVPALVLGYCTLSAAQIEVEQIADVDRKRLPRYPIPCFRMGRLACRSDSQGKGFGRLLIGCAVERCLEAREEIACFALIVDAKDHRAQTFYEHYGFVSCTDGPRTL
jgi:predicted GNAT family N-acyltransferase